MTETAFGRYADSVYSEFLKAVSQAARENAVPESAAYDAVRHELRQRLLIRAAEADSRASLWRARVRLYDARAQNDAIADSDEERAPDAPGAEVCSGLSAVATYLRELALNYHNGVIVEGLDDATLSHKLKSLRPTLSRRGGNATWRVAYSTRAPDAAGGALGVREREPQFWVARVDVERVG